MARRVTANPGAMGEHRKDREHHHVEWPAHVPPQRAGQAVDGETRRSRTGAVVTLACRSGVKQIGVILDSDTCQIGTRNGDETPP